MNVAPDDARASGYDAVCFDLDSTICEPTQDPAAVLETAFDRVGVDQFCRHDELRSLIPDLPTAETDREFHENLFAAAARRAEVDPAVAPDLAESYLETVDPAAVRFRDGAERALEVARERGPVALVTNGGRETQTTKLESLGIADAFDAAVFTDPTAGIHPKPDAAPFERALSGLGTDPDRTVHVGDSLHADIAGANAMGLSSAWVADGRNNDTEHVPTYELESMAELPTLF